MVVADDLTGANVTGVLLAGIGLRSSLILGKTVPDGCDAVLCATESRTLPPLAAYKRVLDTMRKLSGAETQLHSKRIDSTLRGSVLAEAAAASDALGEDRPVFIVPSFPDAGRTVVNGVVLVNGTPLDKTGAARDPLAPVKKSDIISILEGTGYPGQKANVVHIGLNAVREKNSKKLLELYAAGGRFFSFDAETEEDIAFIADAAIASGMKFIAADPGPFTYELARRIFPEVSAGKILLVVGSVTDLTGRQIKTAVSELRTAWTELNMERLLDESQRKAETLRAADELQKSSSQYLLLTFDSLDPEKRLDFPMLARKTGVGTERLSAVVNDAMAKVVKLVCRHTEVAALFASGGDVAASVCKALGASGIRLVDEVMPLSAFGFLTGGEAEQMPIITKGGLVGDDDAIVRCAHYLSRSIKITKASSH